MRFFSLTNESLLRREIAQVDFLNMYVHRGQIKSKKDGGVEMK
jgi:hypothetical protein